MGGEKAMEFYLGMYIIVIARILLAVIFLLNGSGIISQTIAARELAERHVSDRLIPFFMFAARTLEIVAGLALAAGIFPQYAALVLFSFIFPATFVAHTFWSAKNAERPSLASDRTAPARVGSVKIVRAAPPESGKSAIL